MAAKKRPHTSTPPVPPRPRTRAGIDPPWIIANATVFLSSACIMVLELVASRIIARHLGVSLYTWTSVIGIVLTGIAIGNYVGGRLADRFPAKRTLAVLFMLSSATCVVLIPVEQFVGEWEFLWDVSWSVRVATHVALVFFMPSALLGTISPVVAKMALGLGRQTGRTVGCIYAWGVAGSILGTFATGYYLIATLGSSAIVWCVAGLLALLGIAYGLRGWAPWAWAALWVTGLGLALGPWAWAQRAGTALALRKPADPAVLYSDESRYSYIEIRRTATDPDTRDLRLDRFLHNAIIMDDPHNFQSRYERVYAALTHRLAGDKTSLTTLSIGGGGYVFCRYLADTWPGSRTEVVEIDPAVTRAAYEAFGLSPDTPLLITHGDGRRYMDGLWRARQRGEAVPAYDFVYCDAFNDNSVPFQLTTVEFVRTVDRMLAPDGAYMFNLVDVLESGYFLGAAVNTMREVFPHVRVFVEGRPLRTRRSPFIVIGTRRPFDEHDLPAGRWAQGAIVPLPDATLDHIRRQSRALVLTDNYAPVENLLAPLVRSAADEFAVMRINGDGDRLLREGRVDAALARYREAVALKPEWPDPRINVGAALLMLNRHSEAATQMHAVLRVDPDNAEAHNNLAIALYRVGRTGEALHHFREAVRCNPEWEEARNNLRRALEGLENQDPPPPAPR